MASHKRAGWYAAAIAAVALAFAASSTQLFSVGLPTIYHREFPGAGSQFVHFEQTYMKEGTPNRIDVDVAVTSVAPVDEISAPANPWGGHATLWAMDLNFRAEPAVPLRHCEVKIFSGDAEYAPLTDYAVHVDDISGFTFGGCVPSDAPGPDFQGASIVDDGSASHDGEEAVSNKPVGYDGPERPRDYTVTTYVYLPDGLSPTAIQVSWQSPDYVFINDLEVSDTEIAYGGLTANY